MTRDPELRYTPNGTPLCEFGMAINRSWTSRDGETREETCFVDVTMWGRRGEVISEYFSKGQPIFIEGRLKLDQWETPDGKRSKLSVVAENFEFIGAQVAASRGKVHRNGKVHLQSALVPIMRRQKEMISKRRDMMSLTMRYHFSVKRMAKF
jgi:single-strand DNA-binding protein